MQLLLPFVDSALPLAYGVLGVQLFHVRILSFDYLGSRAYSIDKDSLLSLPYLPFCAPIFFSLVGRL